MSEGQGFARRVTLANLTSFAPLLKKTTGVGQAEGTTDTNSETELTSDSANVGIASDPELAAAEALFSGESVRTGIQYSPPVRRRSKRNFRRGVVGGRATTSGSTEVLLWRMKHRRNGNQVQIPMPIQQSSFMNGATEVVLMNGSRKPIGTNTADGKPNTKQFNIPGLKDIEEPVARLRWINPGDAGSGAAPFLQLEVFDAASGEGKRIFRKLQEGIAAPPALTTSKPLRLSREETVLTKKDRKIAQWFRLDSI